MSLKSWRIILIVLAGAAVLIVGLVAWILGTSQGARWLLATVSDISSLEISADSIEGRLWDDLSLKELKIAWKDGYLTADEFYIRWQPLYILVGNVAAHEASIKNLFIQDNSEEKKTDLRWPKITGIPSKLDGWIDSLKITSLSVRKRDQEPMIFRKISSPVIWYDRNLTLRDFSISSSQADAKGTIIAGFRKPSLHADIRILPVTAIRGMTTFLIKVNLVEDKKPFQMKGHFSIDGTDGLNDRMKLKGQIGIKRYAVLIEKLFLTETGRRGSLSGEGEIDLHLKGPEIRASIQVNDLDLSPELKSTTHLQGEISLEGNIGNYAGTLKLSNSGGKWRYAELSGSFKGDKNAVVFLLREGSWLRGNLQGKIEGSWEKGLSISAVLSARKIDPSSIAADWTGLVNFDISGKIDFPKKGETFGELSGKILDSRLRGRSLTGEVEMNLIGKNLIVKRLFLKGKGFDINAKGELLKRLNYFADVSDLSSLIPDTKGSLKAEGWISLVKRLKVAGIVKGMNLAIGDLIIKVLGVDVNFHTREKPPILLSGNLRGISYGDVTVQTAQVEISGSEGKHLLSLSLNSNQWSTHTSISGTYDEKNWSGKIIELYGHDAVGSFKIVNSATFSVSAQRVSLPDISLKGEGTEHLQMRLKVNLNPFEGSLLLNWTGLNLARGNQWIKRTTLQGKTSGKINAAWRGKNLSTLTGTVEASGLLGVYDQHIEIKKASLNVNLNKRNIEGLLDIQMKKHGMIRGTIIVAQPVRLGLPERADIDIRLKGMDATIFRSLLPKEIDIKGNLSAQIKGNLLPDKRTDISGSLTISEGMIIHVTRKGQLSGEIKNAQLSFIWRDDKLSANLELSLADYGNLRGKFSLPLEARLPVLLRKDRPLHVFVEGAAHEKGILTSLFPGLVQESHGKLKLDFTISGSWAEPLYSGKLELSDAGAFLPPAGITLRSVTASARFDRNRLVIETFSAKSGKGGIEGSAEIMMKQFSITGYKGKITGEKFQAVYLPHVQAAINPNLTFEGRKNNVSLLGNIEVAELFVYESEAKVIESSRDVIIVDAPKKKERKTPMNFDINVRVILGDKVFVKMEGIDAKLKGTVDLKATSIDEIRATGAIEVEKGKYKKYGIDLDIKRGKVVFAGGPADNPSLNVLALREIDGVKAGILATGTLKAPRINLYSEPPMSDTDVLSYIVLGHPPGADSEQISLLSRAAGLILSGGESVTLQAKLQQRLGIDVLDIESGGGEIARSMLTVGKYLSPRLYVGYGISLFSGQNTLRLKYKLSKRLELQTESGIETGIDMYYKIEFK